MSSLGIKALQSHAKSEKHKVAVKVCSGCRFCSAPSLTLPGPSTARDAVRLASKVQGSRLVQGSLLFVTYTIIQGIIGSEMLGSGAIPNVDCTMQRRKRIQCHTQWSRLTE